MTYVLSNISLYFFFICGVLKDLSWSVIYQHVFPKIIVRLPLSARVPRDFSWCSINLHVLPWNFWGSLFSGTYSLFFRRDVISSIHLSYSRVFIGSWLMNVCFLVFRVTLTFSARIVVLPLSTDPPPPPPPRIYRSAGPISIPERQERISSHSNVSKTIYNAYFY